MFECTSLNEYMCTQSGVYEIAKFKAQTKVIAHSDTIRPSFYIE